jgi:hypothetical protein
MRMSKLLIGNRRDLFNLGSCCRADLAPVLRRVSPEDPPAARQTRYAAPVCFRKNREGIDISVSLTKSQRLK